MERYEWGDGKIRIRLEEKELSAIGLSPEAILRFGREAKRLLRAFLLSLQEAGALPRGELLAEVFPGRRGAVVQITPERERLTFYLPRTDDMLAVFPLAKASGAALYRRLDGKGYYLTHASEKSAARFSEFAQPCRVSDGILKETCRRIL